MRSQYVKDFLDEGWMKMGPSQKAATLRGVKPHKLHGIFAALNGLDPDSRMKLPFFRQTCLRCTFSFVFCGFLPVSLYVVNV